MFEFIIDLLLDVVIFFVRDGGNLTDGSPKRKVLQLERKAYKGDEDAMFQLARMYTTGNGAERNLRRARRFYTRLLTSSNAAYTKEAREGLARLG